MSTVAALPTIGWPELIVILVIFTLLFGARKLPELASSVGKSIKSFKRGLEDGTEEEPAEDTQPSESSAPAQQDHS